MNNDSLDYPFNETEAAPPLANKVKMVLAGLVVVGALVAGVMMGAPGGGGSGSVLAATGGGFMPFSGTSPYGETVDTADYEGQILVLDFWATWCPPCREKVPEMIALQNEFEDDGVQVIAVSADHKVDDLMKYIERTGINYPNVFGGADQILRAYGIRYLPTVVVVDREGTITVHDYRSDVRGHVAELVEEQPYRG